jgi:hypothetical protein
LAAHACSIAPLFLSFLLPGASVSVLGHLQNELSILLLAVSLWNGFFLLEWHPESICFDFLSCPCDRQTASGTLGQLLCPQLAELRLPRCYSSAHRWCDGFDVRLMLAE